MGRYPVGMLPRPYRGWKPAQMAVTRIGFPDVAQTIVFTVSISSIGFTFDSGVIGLLKIIVKPVGKLLSGDSEFRLFGQIC